MKYDLNVQEIHKRFRELRESTETDQKNAISQRKLAEFTGLKHPRISILENDNDDTIPSINDLLAYRDYFNVSIDYLLALEEASTTSPSMRNIYDEYGLSEASLQNLNYIHENQVDEFGLPYMEALNLILESNMLVDFLTYFYRFIKFNTSESLTYAFNSKITTENFDEYVHSLNSESFRQDIDKISVDSTIFEDILLNKAKDLLKDIKKEDIDHLHYLEKEVLDLNSQIEHLESLTPKLEPRDALIEEMKKLVIYRIDEIKTCKQMIAYKKRRYR